MAPPELHGGSVADEEAEAQRWLSILFTFAPLVSSRAGVPGDFVRHLPGCPIMGQASWARPCSLPLLPGEEEYMYALPRGAGLLGGLSVLEGQCVPWCLSWMHSVGRVVFGWAGRWLWFCPQGGRLACASSTRHKPATGD